MAGGKIGSVKFRSQKDGKETINEVRLLGNLIEQGSSMERWLSHDAVCAIQKRAKELGQEVTEEQITTIFKSAISIEMKIKQLSVVS